MFLTTRFLNTLARISASFSAFISNLSNKLLAKKERAESSEDDGEASETDSEFTFEAGAFCQQFQDTLLSEADLFFNTDEFKMPGLPGGSRFLEFIQQKQ